MSDSVLACENDILDRLKAQMSYLRSCEDVGNIQTALELEQIISPAARVMFAGDTPNEPMSLTVARQLTRLKWNVFIIASSFGPAVEGRRDQPVPGGTEPGIYRMLFDIRSALLGYVLPSQSPFASKLFYLGAEPWTLGESSVVYVSRWYNSVLETGA